MPDRPGREAADPVVDRAAVDECAAQPDRRPDRLAHLVQRRLDLPAGSHAPVHLGRHQQCRGLAVAAGDAGFPQHGEGLAGSAEIEPGGRHRHDEQIGHDQCGGGRSAAVRRQVDHHEVGIDRGDALDPRLRVALVVERQGLAPDRQVPGGQPLGGCGLGVGINQADTAGCGELAGDIHRQRALANATLEIADRHYERHPCTIEAN